MPESNVTIAPGATILVTGVNGLIGSHIADELLQRGYNVRGAVRDVERCSWLHEYFSGKHPGSLSLVSVPDMTVPDCYDEVVKGTSGIIHTASPLSGSDAKTTIPIGTESALNALNAANQTPEVVRVVHTSSSLAATFPSPDAPKTLTQETFNEAAVAKAWAYSSPPPEGENAGERSLTIYAAMKTESEKACWAYMREQERTFTLNTILPNVNFSKVLCPSHQGAPSTIFWAKSAFTGEYFDRLGSGIGPQWYISTRDCARLHVAALLEADVVGERIFGFAQRWDYNVLLAIYRARYPARTFPADLPGLKEDLCEPPHARAEEMLKRVKGEGWDDLEEVVVEMAAQFDSGEV